LHCWRRPSWPVASEAGGENAGFAELDIRGSLAVASTYGRRGFELFDLTNPIAPAFIANFTGERGRTSFDVKVTPDLTTVFIGTGPGVDIVDIRDPSNITVTGTWKFPPHTPTSTVSSANGRITHAHMIYYYEFDAHRLLFVAPQDGTSVHVLKVEGEPGNVTLTTLARAQPDFAGGPLGPHDMWATFDEALGTHVLYVANGFMGWLAYDIKNPASPQLLGGMINPDTHQGYVHTIQAAWINGKRLVVTVAEVGVNAMRVYDATNMRAPVLLGSWTNDNRNAVYPQHNLQIVNGTLYVAHYGHGVFLFDLTKVSTTPYSGMQMLRPIGHLAVPRSNWDVVVKDGLMYVTAGHEMLVAGYGCNVPGDASLTSTG